MRLTIDPETNVAYLRLRETIGEVTTVVVSDELNVDIGPDGTVCGIEFLDAAGQLIAGHDGKLVVVDESTGTTRELVLAPDRNRRRAHAR